MDAPLPSSNNSNISKTPSTERIGWGNLLTSLKGSQNFVDLFADEEVWNKNTHKGPLKTLQ